MSSSENCTYFQSTGTEGAGACRVSICPCSDNICQLRLDFNAFQISGPSTSATSVGYALNGVLVADTMAKMVALQGQCLTDVFSVTSPSGNSPSQICGLNSGEHSN